MPSDHATPRVAMVMTSCATLGDSSDAGGAWYSEVAIPYYVFLDSFCAVSVWSVAGGAVPIDPASRAEPWTTAETARMDADATAQAALRGSGPVAALRAEAFDILVVPGGISTMWDLPDAAPLSRLIEAAAASPDKVVATICHGACALVNAKDRQGGSLVRGRALTSFTDSEERAVGADALVPFLLETRLRALGADHRGGADWSDTVVRDDWLVSGQNPQSAQRAAIAALAALGARRTS
jgi:putative intracellular protease/amidase